MTLPPELWQRILERLVADGDCLIWPGNQHGGSPGARYGRIRFERDVYSVHVVACTVAHGPAPTGRPYALHTCRRSLCGSPDHVYWGTRSEQRKAARPPRRQDYVPPITREAIAAILAARQ